MDKNCNAKLTNKKSQMAAEKTKKSASRKKKRSKKTSSTKSDQSPELLEVEGSRALEQTDDFRNLCGKGEIAQGGESDSSGAQACPRESPTEPQKSSTSLPERSPTATRSASTHNDYDLPTPQSATRTVLDQSAQLVVLKQTVSTGVINERESYPKKASVSFSNFEEVQTISNTLSNMSVKSKNGSSKNKLKSSKTSSNGATKREKTKAEPIKSCINKAAEAAARLKNEESLRWEFALEDDEQELERIHIYKINRRKRYLAAAQEKGLGWVQNYGNNGSPLLEEPTPEFNDQDIAHTATVTDFTPIRNIMASQSSDRLALAGEITC